MMGHQLCSYLNLTLLTRYNAIRVCKNRHMTTMPEINSYMQLNDLALAKNYGQGPPWIPGELLKQSGMVTFVVELTDGTIICLYLGQLKLNRTNQATSDISILDCISLSEVTTPELRHSSCIIHS